MMIRDRAVVILVGRCGFGLDRQAGAALAGWRVRLGLVSLECVWLR